jgi:hypothetical protein
MFPHDSRRVTAAKIGKILCLMPLDTLVPDPFSNRSLRFDERNNGDFTSIYNPNNMKTRITSDNCRTQLSHRL